MLGKLAQLSLVLDTAACRKGRSAYHAGQGEDANPFNPETRLYHEWRVGWKDASRQHRAAA